MAIVINGSGTVTGLAVGGLPDGTVDAGTLATDSVTAAKLEVSAITSADLPSGSIVQVKTTRGDFSGDISTTSTSFVEIHSSLRNTFTPKFANSTLMIEYTTSAAGWSTTYLTYEIRADGARLDGGSDTWVVNTGANSSTPPSVYLEVDSWGTSSKVISPFVKTNNGTAGYANWAGSPAYCFVKITEVAA